MEALLENAGPAVLPRTPSVTSSTILEAATQPKSVKRPRPVKSCIECRKRKLKCDRLGPCSQCQKSRRPCKYTDQENGNGSDVSDGESTERPVKRPQHVAGLPDGDYSRPYSQSNSVLEHYQRPPPPGMEEMAARLELLEKRLDGIVTDKASPTLSYRQASMTIRTGRPLNLTFRFPGGPPRDGTQALLNIFDEAEDLLRTVSRTEHLRQLFARLQNACQTLQKERHKALEPITVFVDSMLPIQKRMVDILPSRPVCDRLVKLYFVVSEGLYRTVHIPSFQQEYAGYWDGKGCNGGFLPRLLCMMCIAARFGTDSRGLGHERYTGIHIPTACALVRHWLDDNRKKQLTDLTTLETELLLLRAQRTITSYQRSCWAQLGYVVRMAMTMDLHRDPSELPSITPFAGELRRRLWYSIIEMDLHVSLVCKLPFAIRQGEYTCRPPLNIDDSVLLPTVHALPAPLPLDHLTANRLQSYTSRTLAARTEAASLLSHLHLLDSYSPVLSAGEKLEAIISDVNALFPRHACLNPEDKHKEWRHRAILDMHARRPLLALYRPFALGLHSNSKDGGGGDPNCPPHIELSYLKSAMAILCHLDEIDPRSPGYDDVVAMYLFVMKKDLVEAGLSVCAYAKRCSQSLQQHQYQNHQQQQHHSPERDGWYGGHHYHHYHDKHGGADMIGPATNRFPWSTATMLQTVERMFDRLLGMIPHFCGGDDLKEIVALGVVLGVVQPGNGERKLAKTRAVMGRLLDAIQAAVPSPVMGHSLTGTTNAGAAATYGVGGGPGSGSGALTGNGTGPTGAGAVVMNGFAVDGVNEEMFNWGNFWNSWDLTTTGGDGQPQQHYGQH
ncbi:fungal-specific transcription factor domain-containing protein [Podospora australis]|uniref:Fungal-specific transcription factor domain-containing protein n=1 Tax=Podospora australis TaxID=1536484 RepID=A0AAN6WX52_9PEZI|nr:fungal-specific transcription factor domain-containing protein [Podospora australis]